jgi:hypothetical protein
MADSVVDLTDDLSNMAAQNSRIAQQLGFKLQLEASVTSPDRLVQS